MANRDGDDFSKLEAGFAEIKIERRRVSLEEIPNRHANESEKRNANDLDFNYDVSSDMLPPNLYPSMQVILPALQYSSHMVNLNNFAERTDIECFDQSDDGAVFHKLDSTRLEKVLNSIKEKSPDVDVDETPTATAVPAPATQTESRTRTAQHTSVPSHQPSSAPGTTCPTTKPVSPPATRSRLLVFFVPLSNKKEASFGAQISMQRASAQKLFNALGANPEFLPNMLGRPDYWSPRSRWQCSTDDELELCDYFCQHPRWNIQLQGAPLSVYMIRQVKSKLTAYIISHKAGDTCIHALQQILKVGANQFDMKSHPSNYLTNPFEIAVLLSSLSFEASKFHMARFRRYMWEQVNKVDDHLAGLDTSDRNRLTELTKSLQIISQQADSHLLNANVAIIAATGIRDAQAKLHDHLSTPTIFRQPAEDAIKYVIDSMEKQKMLFLNYKGRKDSTMGLVYNLVTQSDAANNIQLAQSMKRDSTSMSAIACLTMILLPGTFTSSILSAGIFSAKANSDGFDTSSLWWLWVVLTIPLTVIVLSAWWIYRRRSEHQKQDLYNNLNMERVREAGVTPV